MVFTTCVVDWYYAGDYWNGFSFCVHYNVHKYGSGHTISFCKPSLQYLTKKKEEWCWQQQQKKSFKCRRQQKKGYFAKAFQFFYSLPWIKFKSYKKKDCVYEKERERTEENDEKNNEANRHEFAHIYSSFQSIILQFNFFFYRIRKKSIRSVCNKSQTFFIWKTNSLYLRSALQPAKMFWSSTIFPIHSEQLDCNSDSTTHIHTKYGVKCCSL